MSFTTTSPFASRSPSLKSSSSVHLEGWFEIIISRSWFSPWSLNIFEFVVKSRFMPLLPRNAYILPVISLLDDPGLVLQWQQASAFDFRCVLISKRVSQPSLQTNTTHASEGQASCL